MNKKRKGTRKRTRNRKRGEEEKKEEEERQELVGEMNGPISYGKREGPQLKRLWHSWQSRLLQDVSTAPAKLPEWVQYILTCTPTHIFCTA